jgi:hypothetical protein
MIITDAVYNVARRADMFVPVNNRFLKGSIRPNMDADKLGGDVSVSKSYGPYVEWGTGDGVIVPNDLREYAMTFKGKGIRKVNNRARPYLFPALRITITELTKRLETLGFKR